MLISLLANDVIYSYAAETSAEQGIEGQALAEGGETSGNDVTDTESADETETSDDNGNDNSGGGEDNSDGDISSEDGDTTESTEGEAETGEETQGEITENETDEDIAGEETESIEEDESPDDEEELTDEEKITGKKGSGKDITTEDEVPDGEDDPQIGRALGLYEDGFYSADTNVSQQSIDSGECEMAQFNTTGTYYHDERFNGYEIKKGIDVSRHNGSIDWNAVKADGIDFAFIRIGFRGYGSSGSLNMDDRYLTNIQQAKNVGIKVGVYIFSQATSNAEAAEEAKAETEASTATESDDAATATETADYGEFLSKLNMTDYVTLGEYKGLSIDYTVEPVTDGDVDDYIKQALASQATTVEITEDRPVQEGDIVNIDYEGKKDGVAFDGGTAQGADLGIGTHTFIEGFESGLIGAKKGDTLDLNLTFPENYGKAELAGADVVFTVTINAIKEKVTPELTDETASSVMADASTAEDCKKLVREQLEKGNEDTALLSAKNQLIEQATGNATINKAPDGLKQEKLDYMKASAESYATSYGVDLETFVGQALGATMDEFEAQCEEYAQTDVEQVLVAYAIAQAEGIVMSDEEAKEAIEPYLAALGAEDYDSLMKTATGRGYLEYLQMEKVTDFLMDNAVKN